VQAAGEHTVHRRCRRLKRRGLRFVASRSRPGAGRKKLASLDQTKPALNPLPRKPAMNTTSTTARATRLLSFAFAALLTIGVLASVDHLAGTPKASPVWAHAVSGSAQA
jgi:hypothetical protein